MAGGGGLGGACLLPQVCEREGEAGWDRGRWAGSQKTDIVLVGGEKGNSSEKPQL